MSLIFTYIIHCADKLLKYSHHDIYMADPHDRAV
jgi:hypothetical protein